MQYYKYVEFWTLFTMIRHEAILTTYIYIYNYIYIYFILLYFPWLYPNTQYYTTTKRQFLTSTKYRCPNLTLILKEFWKKEFYDFVRYIC